MPNVSHHPAIGDRFNLQQIFGLVMWNKITRKGHLPTPDLFSNVPQTLELITPWVQFHYCSNLFKGGLVSGKSVKSEWPCWKINRSGAHFLRDRHIEKITQQSFGAFLSHRATPNHPTLRCGFSMEINHPASLGYPHFPSWKPMIVSGIPRV